MDARVFSFASLVLAVMLVAGCGSSSSSQSSSTGSATRPHAANVTLKLPGTHGGRKPTPAIAKALHVPRRSGVHAHLVGLAGVSLGQKLQYFANNVGSFWTTVAGHAGVNIPPVNVTVVDPAPAACGSTQIATTDHPSYCGQSATIFLPLAFMQTSVAPSGDAAIGFVVADLYGQHLENVLGLSAQEPAATLESQAVCYAGNYFTSLESAGAQVHLGAGDEAAVNMAIAAEANSPSVPGSAGVSAADLTTAFNRGVTGNSCRTQSGG